MANVYDRRGLRKLNEELIELESVQRPEISRQIAEARIKVIYPRSEYDAAKKRKVCWKLRSPS